MIVVAMDQQAHFWSKAAKDYEKEFVDPYRDDVRSPLLPALLDLADPKSKIVADLGCGTGPLLPFLSTHFHKVHAVDFAEGMLDRARERCRNLGNIEFQQLALTNLGELAGQADVAVAVNSLVLPQIPDLEESLRQVYSILKPGGVFLGIVPAIDAVHYFSMLLLDRALEAGLPMEAARKNVAHFNDHKHYDFAFGQFRYAGLEQHFWQPFEISYRLGRAGFHNLSEAKVLLAWEQMACGADLHRHPPPWDWFFHATRDPEKK